MYLNIVKRKYAVHALLDKSQESDLQIDLDKAQVHVAEVSGSYELTVSILVSSELVAEKKKDIQDKLIKLLPTYLNERIGKNFGKPNFQFENRPKNDMVAIKASWTFDDAFFAYALGLDLGKFRGKDEVVDKDKIAGRHNLAEKAMEEMKNFLSDSQKKIKSRSQDPEEQKKIWKKEFLAKWVSLDNKWASKGIAYSQLKNAKKAA